MRIRYIGPLPMLPLAGQSGTIYMARRGELLVDQASGSADVADVDAEQFLLVPSIFAKVDDDSGDPPPAPRKEPEPEPEPAAEVVVEPPPEADVPDTEADGGGSTALSLLPADRDAEQFTRKEWLAAAVDAGVNLTFLQKKTKPKAALVELLYKIAEDL